MNGNQQKSTTVHSVIWFADIGFLICLPFVTVIYSLYNHVATLFVPLVIIQIIVGGIGYFISETRKVVVDSNNQVITIRNGLGNTIELPFGSITSIIKGKEYFTLHFSSKNNGFFRLNYNFYMADDQKKILSLLKEFNSDADLISSN